ncbi:hypothetical protein MNBD_UNCLBAC01-2118 [hydrothermal vent metagenome]|uniref:PpiC domain-containing protein n=1 Tax=hydrothermal vent metagenome TaxID=652676 RepID=A0A3B1DTG7_9ZZZZ
MKNFKNIILAMCIIFGSCTQSFAFEDAIIAVVNDELITLKDLKDYVRSTYASLVAQGMDEQKIQVIMEDLEKNGVNKLIEDSLILSRANDLGIIVRDKIIDERIKDLKKKYPSEQVFIGGLVKNGSSLTDLRNKIKDQLKIQFVVDHEIKSKLYITPQEVTEFYEQNIEKFKKKERVNLDSIFIAFKEDEKRAQQRIQEALKLIEEGKSFRDVAKQFSDTPSIGVIEKGQVLPMIEDVVFNLSKGDISSVITVSNGMFIFKLLGKTVAQSAPLDEVKEYVSNMLEQKKFQEKIMAWLEKLKQEAYIEIKQ